MKNFSCTFLNVAVSLFLLTFSACSPIDNFDETLLLDEQSGISSSEESSLSSSSKKNESSSSVENIESSSSSVTELSSSSEHSCPKTVTDSRGETDELYDVIEFYDRQSNTLACWFDKNLNYKVKGSLCYEDDDANCDLYGRLYKGENFAGLCPEGFHVSTFEDWNQLFSVLGVSCGITGCTDVGWNLKAVDSWVYDSGASKSKDSYGFSAFAGGMYDKGHSSEDGEVRDYEFKGLSGYWWIANENKDPGIIRIDNNSDDAYLSEEVDYVSNIGYSIRCVMDK